MFGGSFRSNNVISSGSSYRGCRTSSHSKSSYTQATLTDTQPDSEKNADEELENRQSEKARYLDDETCDARGASSHGGNDITRTVQGLSRRSNLNGPFGTGKARLASLIESIESN